jgi:hypothetical protein
LNILYDLSEYKESPKILNLILYSETSPEYIEMYKTLSNYLKKIDIPYYFYAYNPNLESDYIIKDDIIYMKGNESLVPGCLDKTFKAFEICKDLEFDYLIRTNISQVVNFKLLKKALENSEIEYGGGINFMLKWFDPMSGIVNTKYWGNNFIRGNAIIFNRETFNLILDGKNEILSYNIIDDVAFGVFLKDKIKIIKTIGDAENSSYDEKIIFYRNKSVDRRFDVENMRNITSRLIIT